jgi:hypothetical protein
VVGILCLHWCFVKIEVDEEGKRTVDKHLHTFLVRNLMLLRVFIINRKPLISPLSIIQRSNFRRK